MKEWGEFEPSDESEEEEEHESDLEEGESSEKKKDVSVSKSESSIRMPDNNLRGQPMSINQSLLTKENVLISLGGMFNLFAYE